MQFKFRRLAFFLVTFLYFLSEKTNAQLVISGGLTGQQLVQNVLIGSGITVNNVVMTCDTTAIGVFNGTASNLGLAYGIVMTSGDKTETIGPNNSSGAGLDNGTPGDADLNTIASATTFNACVLEFDFIPISNTMAVRYVFGSEEYLEYVNSGYNDVFAFFISGPGITGKKNIALIPGTSTPVSIDNVNNVANAAYYFDNENPPGVSVQYDGFTKVLTATQTVQACQTYHIKLAVADAGDGILDSGVFLEAGSFTGGNVSLSADAFSPDSTAIEGCVPVVVNFCIPFPASNDYVVHYELKGDATNGTDYIQLPDSIVIPAGQTCASFTINPIKDSLTEGSESVFITLPQFSACDTLIKDSLAIFINDLEPVVLTVSNDTAICLGDTAVLFASASGGQGQFRYIWSTNQTTDSIIKGPSTTTDYVVYAIDSCGNQKGDTVHLEVIQFPKAEFTMPDTVCGFVDAPVVFTGVASSIATFNWNFAEGVIDSGSGPGPYQVKWKTPGPKLITLSVTEPCNTASDSAIIFIETCNVYPPNIITPNNDGNNDRFVILNLEEHPNSRLVIYNRWGNKMYETKNYLNDWEGKDVSDGVYFYILYLNDGTENHGTITVIKSK